MSLRSEVPSSSRHIIAHSQCRSEHYINLTEGIALILNMILTHIIRKDTEDEDSNSKRKVRKDFLIYLKPVWNLHTCKTSQ
jgi:hypothetical protein